MVGKLLRFGSIIAWILRIVVCMGYVISIQNLFNFVHVSLVFSFSFFFLTKKISLCGCAYVYSRAFISPAIKVCKLWLL